MTRHWLRTAAAALSFTSLYACSSLCEDYCEQEIPCIEDQLDESSPGCNLKGSSEELQNDCVSACESGMEAVAEDDRSEWENCASCVLDATQKDVCVGEEVEDAFEGTCSAECENERMEDAAEDFFEEFNDRIDLETDCD